MLSGSCPLSEFINTLEQAVVGGVRLHGTEPLSTEMHIYFPYVGFILFFRGRTIRLPNPQNKS